MIKAVCEKQDSLSKYQQYFEIGYVILCGCFFFIWSIAKELNYGPDELMRYQIPEYIFKNGSLPNGNAIELRNETWGFSYAYYPNFIGPILSTVFMKIVSLFTMDEFALLVAARFTSVLSGAFTVFFLLKICQRLFSVETKWLVTILISMIPQFVFLTSYVNNDIICICGSGMICYAWVCGLQDGWNYKNASILSIGIIIATLSYYNSYGWILCSMFLFILSYMLQKGKKDYKTMFKIGCFIAILVIAVCAGFFIRNAILYQGDFLGMKSLNMSSEKYAVEWLKPSNRNIAANKGMSLSEMIHSKEWTGVTWGYLTLKSFIGVFGYMIVYPPDWVYTVYHVLFIVCSIGFFGQIIMWIIKRKNFYFENGQKTALFYGAIAVSFCIPIGLSLYYSFAVDYQPQGRYCYPMVIALAVMFGTGIEWYFSKIRSLYSSILSMIVSCAFIAITIFVFINSYLPS